MLRIITTLVFLLFAIFCYAQEEQVISKKVAAQFDKYYNEKDYEAIFNMLSPEMKAALPHDQAITFLTTLNTQVGALKTRAFINYKQGRVALYKTQFEKATLALYLSVDDTEKINGMLVKPYQAENIPRPERNTSNLILPFKGEWTVFWGGDTQALNYHVTTPSQKNAFDLVITDERGKSYQTNGKTNEDYYAFGKELIAPVSGEVVQVIDGIEDNQPGTMDPATVTGNTVIIKAGNNEYYLLAHFQQNSIKVKKGDHVTQGQVLGLCGNSGNSSEPHLHFHIQNTEDMGEATGIKCYFEEINVNGTSKKDYSPIKGDRISN